MKHHRYIRLINFFLAIVFVSGLISGCASTKEKKLIKNGFSISFKDKFSAGSAISKIQLNHPLEISESDTRRHLKSLVFEELSLFGKKQSVFTSEDLDRMGRLISKAFHHVPSHKVISYELETPGGTTSGNIFASKKFIHWQFDSIKGMRFSGRSNTGWGGANWRMVPQSGQKYQAVRKLLGDQAQENWIFSELRPSSKTHRGSKPENAPQHSPNQAPSEEPSDHSPSTTKSTDPELEEKLELLKGLYEKNLLDEKEYHQKRKELLDTYL